MNLHDISATSTSNWRVYHSTTWAKERALSHTSSEYGLYRETVQYYLGCLASFFKGATTAAALGTSTVLLV